MVGAKVMTGLDQVTTTMHGRTVDLTFTALLQIIAGNKHGTTHHLTLRQPAGGPTKGDNVPGALAIYPKAASPALFISTSATTDGANNTAEISAATTTVEDLADSTPAPPAPTGSAFAQRMHLLAKQFESTTKDKTIGPSDFIPWHSRPSRTWPAPQGTR